MLSKRWLIPIVAACCAFSVLFAHEKPSVATVVPVSSERVFANADSQRLTVLVELAGTRARLAELDRQMKQYQIELQTKLKTDPIAGELQKVIDPLQKSADRKHSSPDSYSPPDVERADMELATERAHLLERQEQFGDDAPLLMQLRHDRITVATQLAELEAESRAIQQFDHVGRTSVADAR